jgi:hypothetical protein
MADPSARVTVQTTPQPGGLQYDITIPDAALGLNENVLGTQGIAFNLLVNDNDGAVRKGWVNITPGLGETKDPSLYRTIVWKMTPHQ